MHPTWQNSRFLKACRSESVDATPVWLMRQAGRYLPEYRKLREKNTLLEMIRNPEVAATVTLQPLDRYPLDAAILFSDLLPPLEAMGLGLEFVGGEGPKILRPIQSRKDVDLMPVPSAAETLPETAKTIQILVPELERRGVPLIGFAGAPFTLAAYSIEGGGSRNYEKTRAFLYREPAAWQRLMKKIAAFQIDYLTTQIQAGVAAVQLFDSWVGVLSRDEYVDYVQPYNKTIFQALEKFGVPILHFTTRTSAYLEEVAGCGPGPVGVDPQLPLGEAWKRIGWDRAIMGNLEPLALLAPWRELKYRIDRVLDQAAGRNGHIFNLGHGLVPSIDPDQVARLIDYVHEKTGSAS